MLGKHIYKRAHSEVGVQHCIKTEGVYMKKSVYLLGLLLTLAGLRSHATEAQEQNIDDQTAAQIIAALVSPQDHAKLDQIIASQSIDDLSEEQKFALLNILKRSAIRMNGRMVTFP